MTVQTKAGLDDATLEAVRDLILVLADSKRLLGYRYAEWMLGAPELETSIACSSMAQDEWGHARLLYALLKAFGDDVEALEHGREPEAYRNMSVLDAPAGSWPDTVALMVLADGALTVQFEALMGSSYDPLRQRVEKLVEEEKFHAAHGAAWFKRLAGGSEASAAALRESIEAALPPVLDWFGPDSDRVRQLERAGVARESGSRLRGRLLDRVAPLLDELGIDRPTGDEPADFDEVRRRVGSGAPDEPTIRKVRGDLNRDFLMD
jgi:ring-1,2-phenylacetyl-CoA epoxidase subunit PaaC